MKDIKLTALRVLIVMSGAFALGACGASPASSIGASSRLHDDGSAGFLHTRERALKILEEENRLKTNPLCGEASGDFKPAVLQIIDRFNETAEENAVSGGEPLLPAGHPDSADGVSVRVCSDGLVAAYAFTRTVVVHEGLLSTLRHAAQAQALFGADSERSRALLDVITSGVESASFEEALAADERYYLAEDPEVSRLASELFISAAAFVIFHELAHTQPGHSASYVGENGAQDPLNPYRELEADSFAAETMRSAGFSTEGIDLVFAVLDRINPEGSISHPSSWERAQMARMAKNGEPLAYSLR